MGESPAETPGSAESSKQPGRGRLLSQPRGTFSLPASPRRSQSRLPALAGLGASFSFHQLRGRMRREPRPPTSRTVLGCSNLR